MVVVIVVVLWARALKSLAARDQKTLENLGVYGVVSCIFKAFWCIQGPGGLFYYRDDFCTTKSISLLRDRFLYYRVDF